MRLPLSLVASTFLLASCGYTPLYAPQPGETAASGRVQIGQVEMQDVKINVGERQVAQEVAKRLKLDYPHTGATLDTASVNIAETTSALAVERTSALRRAQITLTGHLELTGAQGGTLLKADLTTSAAYNVENTPYSTETGKTYARLTAARTLAEEVSRRIAYFYRVNPNATPITAPSPATTVSRTQIFNLNVPLGGGTPSATAPGLFPAQE